MTHARAIDALFGKARQGVITLLFGHPEETFYIRQIVERVGAGTSQVQRELDRLTRAGLLLREPRDRHVYFRANPGAAIFAELAALAQKLGTTETAPLASPVESRPTAKLSAVQQAAIARIARQHGLRRVSMFGSAARRRTKATSDIDLLIEFAPNTRPSLWELPALQEELGRVFGGRRVDLATPEILENPYRRASVLRDLAVLYAA
jgi:predicted nucleotidyltransferase